MSNTAHSANPGSNQPLDEEDSSTRVLVTWGTERGGTEGIARMLGGALEAEGLEVTLKPASEVAGVSAFDAVVVGGALYANRWHSHARRFVSRNLEGLREIPVWFFSSGPLDDSADRKIIPPTRQVEVLMERVGAVGHMTFGGRLEADAKGFIASSMAKKMSGDFRNLDRIRTWARHLAQELPAAAPLPAEEHPARSMRRLLAHAIVGWALCALVMGVWLIAASEPVAIAFHAVAAPLIFAAVSVSYFRAWGAREPLPTALSFAAIVAALDLVVVSGVVLRDLAMFSSFGGTWLPLLLIFLSSWIVGGLYTTLPWPKPEERKPRRHAPEARPHQA